MTNVEVVSPRGSTLIAPADRHWMPAGDIGAHVRGRVALDAAPAATASGQAGSH